MKLPHPGDSIFVRRIEIISYFYQPLCTPKLGITLWRDDRDKLHHLLIIRENQDLLTLNRSIYQCQQLALCFVKCHSIHICTPLSE
jgi:hypothetical protein